MLDAMNIIFYTVSILILYTVQNISTFFQIISPNFHAYAHTVQ